MNPSEQFIEVKRRDIARARATAARSLRQLADAATRAAEALNSGRTPSASEVRGAFNSAHTDLGRAVALTSALDSIEDYREFVSGVSS